MGNILTKLEWLASRCGFALLIFMSFVIGIQVFMRYILNNSLMWPEELTRYCFLWCSMLGLVVTEQRGEHLRIDVLRTFSSPSVQKLLDIFASIVTIAFYCFFIYLSTQMTFMVIDMEQYAISFDLPMVYVWIAFPVLAFAALLFSFVNIGKILKG